MVKTQQQPGASGAPPIPSAARSRILATADRLFYGEGIRAVGVDRVVSEAKVTRVTFYAECREALGTQGEIRWQTACSGADHSGRQD
jgi:hypothetical protein